ncbi:hypothetical protein WJX73_004677 [Symbiochloris irregularis]|uniref:Poly A polymerase head domain-containing protein n=1 Tax=Symbiochloris irregularis TaxID=706552 RepID=A0AAW1Q3Q5_9CHLO
MLKPRPNSQGTYLVGGAKRDLLLGRTPKDHDLLSSAALAGVKRLVKQTVKVGRRHPIIHVRRGSTIHEVSSFETNMDAQNVPRDVGALLSGKVHCPLFHGLHYSLALRANVANPADHASSIAWRMLCQQARQTKPPWSTVRGENAASCDFTINALMYDPFSGILYDYTGGVADRQQRVVRCVGEAVANFEDDPARMLRAVRHAGRAGAALP